MVDFWRQTHWIFRALFLGLTLLLLFMRLLPLNHSAGGLPGPDLLICLILAWIVRRPDFLPMPLIAGVILLATLILGWLLVRPLSWPFPSCPNTPAASPRCATG